MTLLNLEHVLQQTILVMFIIILELARTVVVKSHSFATVHINILLVNCLGFISSVSVLIRLLREERAKLGSLSSVRHTRSFSSETADATLRMMWDWALGTSTRDASLPTCRLSTYYFDVVNLFGYFEPLFVKESHMRHLFRFPNLFLWKFLESRELCAFFALFYFCCSGLWSILSLFGPWFRWFAHFLFVYLFLSFFYEVLMVNLAWRFSFVPRLRKHNWILTKRWLMRMMMIAAILALIIVK